MNWGGGGRSGHPRNKPFVAFSARLQTSNSAKHSKSPNPFSHFLEMTGCTQQAFRFYFIALRREPLGHN
jgi:hypothetical protein